MPKTYTLELTAAEVWSLSGTRLAGSMQLRAVRFKLAELDRQAVADRDADELRLPWRAERVDSPVAPYWRMVFGVGDESERVALYAPERAVKLMSGAPELDDLARAIEAFAKTYVTEKGDSWAEGAFRRDVAPLLARARRKVETGIPEVEP